MISLRSGKAVADARLTVFCFSRSAFKEGVALAEKGPGSGECVGVVISPTCPSEYIFGDIAALLRSVFYFLSSLNYLRAI